MSLEQILGVEEKLVDRTVEEVRQFAAQNSQPLIAPEDSLYWAKAIYNWMQENFATLLAVEHPNAVFESRGVDCLTILAGGKFSRYEGIDISGRYKASELSQAAIYAMLANRFGLEAKVILDDVEFPAFTGVGGMDEPIRAATGRLYSVAITAGNEGGTGEFRVLPCYSNGFGIDLSGEVALGGDQTLTAVPKKTFEPSEKAVAALIRAGQAGFLNIEEASRHYEEALQELGPDAKTLYDYAEAVRSAGMHSARLSEKSAQLFRKVLELDRDCQSAQSFLKTAEGAATRAKAELEHQKRAVAANPDDAQAALFFYFLLRREGSDDGFTLAEKLLKSEKAGSAGNWMQLAEDCYKLRGNPEKAVEILQGSIRQFPNDWVLRYKLGNFLFALGNWEEAAQQLELSIAAHFEHTRNNYLGVANATLGKLEESAGFFRQGVEENAWHTEIRRNLAIARFWQGTPESLEEAKKEFLDNILRATNRHDILSMLYLGAIYQKQGTKRLAFDYYTQALEINPDMETVRSLLKSVSNGLTLEEALEPLRPKRTGFKPNMQPAAQQSRMLDFTQAHLYDSEGRLDEALAELDRLAEDAARPGKTSPGNAFIIPSYKEIVSLRKRALAAVGTEDFGAFPKLTDYSIGNAFYGTLDEVCVANRIGKVVLSVNPTAITLAGQYTKITDPYSDNETDERPIVVRATEENDAAVTEQIARSQERNSGRKRLLLENLHGMLGLKDNTEITLETIAGDVTGEVGRVTGKISVQHGNVDLLLREPIEVSISSPQAVITNMVKTNGDTYSPQGMRSDYRLAISSPGQIKVIYRPYPK